MSPLAFSLLVFACIAGAGLLGMVVGQRLPEKHLHQESKDAIKQGLAVIATLAALVLGLLIASAKGGYDTQTTAVRQLAADILLLDRVLALYGPDTKEAREVLRRGIAATLDRIWPEDGGRAANLTPGEARAEMEIFYDKIGKLDPQNDTQRALKARALDITAGLVQTRLRLFAQKDGSIPAPFLVVLVFWLVILLGGSGLMAPRNATVIVFLIVCALSVSGALFLILELDTPFDGLMRISSAPLREALSRLGN